MEAIILARRDRLNELSQTRSDYWRELVNYMKQRNSPVVFNKLGSIHQLWANAKTLGNGHFILVALATIRPLHIGVGVEISDSKYYEALEKDQSKIQNEIGYESNRKQKFQWIPDHGTKVGDIWLYWDVDFFERQKWMEQHKWLCDKLEVFRRVLVPRINELTALRA